MSEDKEQKTPEQEIISKYMSSLGKKGGSANKAKGSDYFKWVRSHGTKKAKDKD